MSRLPLKKAQVDAHECQNGIFHDDKKPARLEKCFEDEQDLKRAGVQWSAQQLLRSHNQHVCAGLEEGGEIMCNLGCFDLTAHWMSSSVFLPTSAVIMICINDIDSPAFNCYFSLVIHLKAFLLLNPADGWHRRRALSVHTQLTEPFSSSSPKRSLLEGRRIKRN